MKAALYIFLCLIFTLPALAGNSDKYPIRWNKISKAEFQVKPMGRDSNASAIILCDFGNIEVTNRTFYSRHKRIKILNDQGLRFATVEIPYQSKDNHDDFTELKARTLIMENGKIRSYKVPSAQMERIQVNDRWSTLKITFPNVVAGAIIEYEYTLASLDFENLDTWYFQSEIPTVWSEIRFEVPEQYVYLVTFENNRKLAPDEEEAFGRKVQWMFDTKDRRRRIELVNTNELLYATAENRFKVWALNDRKKTITMKNLPALSYATGDQPVTEFYPKVTFDLFESSGILPRSFRPLLLTTVDDYEVRGERQLMHDGTQIPGYVHYRMKTWTQYNESLLKQERFGKYLLKSPGTKLLIDSITRGSEDPRTRSALIYAYIVNTFKWNGEYSMYAIENLDDFLRLKSGSSAEINLLLVNMLQRAGIKANPLLVRTSDLGAPKTMYPVRSQFNHVIAIAEVNGEQILLDATSGTTDMGRLNKKDIGTLGWIVSETNFGWIEIFSPKGDSQVGDRVYILTIHPLRG
jgi:transglutaminase-like putative cysteine protease